MRWAPNPIALARTVLGAAPEGRGWPGSWEEAEELLADAFRKADANAVFEGSGSSRAVIDLIDDVTASIANPQPIGEILGSPAVRKLAAYVPSEEALARLLPFIAPVQDVDFAPPGTGFTLGTHAPAIGRYERIGALDVGGVSWLDPEQGNLADCYLIATMSAIAWARPHTWRQRLTAATNGSKEADTLHVTFYPEVDGMPEPPAFDVPPKVPLDHHRNWIYAHSAQSEETWPALLERAYVMHSCGKRDGEPGVQDYRSIGEDNGRGWPHDVAHMLVGGRAQVCDAHLSAKLAEICDASLTRFPTMASTASAAGPGLVRNHAYSVLGVLSRDDRQFVVLRNPYGNNKRLANFAHGEWKEGSSRNGRHSVALDHHGVFALDAAAFDGNFVKLSWVELPPDQPEA